MSPIRPLVAALASATPAPTPGASATPTTPTTAPLTVPLPGTGRVPLVEVTTPLRDACGDTPTTNCQHVFDVTHSTFLAGLADPILRGFAIVLIVVVALVLRLVIGRLIRRLVRSTASGGHDHPQPVDVPATAGGGSDAGRPDKPDELDAPDELDELDELDEPGMLDGLRLDLSARLLSLDPETVARRTQRASTVGSVLRSISNVVIFSLAFVLILGELGLNLAPILASAGIVGVAVGFGAQSIVKDFLSGIFLVLEDQYGVGDVIDLGPTMKVVGTVESVGLRSTRIRDVHGNLWHLRNGDISQVGNISQGWSRIVLDVTLVHGTDIEAARRVFLGTATAVAADEEFTSSVLEDAAVWGVEDVSIDGVLLRLAVKVKATEKDTVARALRERLVVALAAAGIAVARGTREVVVRPAGTAS